MDKKDCPAGKRYDLLVKLCRPLRTSSSRRTGTRTKNGTRNEKGTISRSSQNHTEPSRPPVVQDKYPTSTTLSNSGSLVIPSSAVVLVSEMIPGSKMDLGSEVVPGSGVVLVQALWMLLPLAILGSVFAVTLWILYSRRRRRGSCPEDPECYQEAVQKPDPALSDPPSPCWGAVTFGEERGLH